MPYPWMLIVRCSWVSMIGTGNCSWHHVLSIWLGQMLLVMEGLLLLLGHCFCDWIWSNTIFPISRKYFRRKILFAVQRQSCFCSCLEMFHLIKIFVSKNMLHNIFHNLILYSVIRLCTLSHKWNNYIVNEPYQSSGSQSRNPLANGLLAILSCVIWKKLTHLFSNVTFISNSCL